MKVNLKLSSLLVAAVLILPAATAHSKDAAGGLGFDADIIGDAGTGEVLMAGGGAFNAATGLLGMGGTFRCLADVQQGPLSGLKAGEGVRWKGTELLPSSGFKCGAPGELLKTAVTDDHTVVMTVQFFRAGDGDVPSFTAKVFVSNEDLAPDLSGTQNVWIQGVGCGDARVNFR